LKLILPFRQENEKTILNKIHPLVRFILPFILVIPFLIINDIYLIISIIFIALILSIVFQLKNLRILSRFKVVLPFMLLITIFIPLYVGESVVYQLNLGFKINIYEEGLFLALLIFLRILGSIYIFMSFFSSLTYSEFIEAITKLRIPSIFVGSLIIMLHYVPILAVSNQKILEAQELRGKKITTYWQKLKTHAFVMGKSIVMNMERGEKLYESLKMRGFSGKLTFAARNIKILDVVLLILFLFIIIVLIYFIDLGTLYEEVFELFLS